MSFPPEIIAAAQAAQRKWGVPASVTLAQWAIESNWGRTMPAGSNNPFGIKAVPGQPSVTAHTREVVHGQSVYIDAPFRKFASIAEAFDEHGRLLATAHPYGRVMASYAIDHNADHFADALTGVYATAPNYGSVLKSVMRANNLYQYDVAPVPANSLNTRASAAPSLAVGDIAGALRSLTLLGYTGATGPAITVFQRDHGLIMDGIAGPLTVAAINADLAKRTNS